MAVVGTVVVEMKGDASDLDKTLTSVKIGIGNTTSAFKAAQASIARMAGNVETLRQKQELLAKALSDGKNAFSGNTSLMAAARVELERTTAELNRLTGAEQHFVAAAKDAGQASVGQASKMAQLRATADAVDNKMGRLQIAIGGVGDALGVSGGALGRFVGGIADMAMALAAGGPLLAGVVALGVAVAGIAGSVSEAQDLAIAATEARKKELADFTTQARDLAAELADVNAELTAIRTGKSLQLVRNEADLAALQARRQDLTMRAAVFGSTPEGQRSEAFREIIDGEGGIKDLDKEIRQLTEVMKKRAELEKAQALQVSKPTRSAAVTSAVVQQAVIAQQVSLDEMDLKELSVAADAASESLGTVVQAFNVDEVRAVDELLGAAEETAAGLGVVAQEVSMTDLGGPLSDLELAVSSTSTAINQQAASLASSLGGALLGGMASGNMPSLASIAGPLGTAIGAAAGIPMAGEVAGALAAAFERGLKTFTAPLERLFDDQRAQQAIDAGGAAFAYAGFNPFTIATTGLSAVLLNLSMQTEAYAQAQQALGLIMDRVIVVLEPVGARFDAVVGVVDVFVEAMWPAIEAFVATEQITTLFFYAAKFAAATLLTLSGKFEEAGELMELSLEDARERARDLRRDAERRAAEEQARAAEAAGAVADEMERLAGSSANLPAGYRVALGAYRADAPRRGPQDSMTIIVQGPLQVLSRTGRIDEEFMREMQRRLGVPNYRRRDDGGTN